MKRLAVFGALALCLAVLAPAASAQSNDDKNHGNFGVYFDYTRLQFAKENFFGVGGRLGINIHPHVVLEGEMAYDFERNSTATITGVTGTTTTVRSNLRLIHGLFGPKFQTTGPVRVFMVLKGGLLNFSTGGAVTGGTVATQIGGISDGDTNGVFYPGGGVEFNAGIFGLRLEAGDEIYFDNGANHNFKFMGGPQIRF
jgi:outer membrane protein with beta-barrel domain